MSKEIMVLQGDDTAAYTAEEAWHPPNNVIGHRWE